MQTLETSILHKKLSNATKLYSSFLISSLTKEEHYWGKPSAVSIEPANFCNLHCPQCPTGMGILNRKHKLLDMQSFHLIMRQLLPEIMYLTLYFQGEPFLNKHLPEMVEYASDHGVFSCISTNGHFFDTETASRLKKGGLGKLIVSLDGADAKSYARYRVGGDFEKVVNCLKIAADAGLPVELQCLLLESTENETEKIKELAKKVCVNKIRFKTAQLYSDLLMPKDEKLSRYTKDSEGNLKIKKALHNRCFRLWKSIVITVDGDVLPCCYDKNGAYKFGNIFEGSIDDILHSENARKFRQQLLDDRSKIDICLNCNE